MATSKKDNQDQANDEQQEQTHQDVVTTRSIAEEMDESYLDYAMSVIVQRALPDVRDGLKPVHRRILYAMHGLGLRHNAKYRKSATVVGEVLGKYHPHGDTAVYDSMVRLAQDFSMRYMLVDGQGNFGSMDGDGAAAMRYTEAKMEKIAETVLADIEKDTVDFRPNYDGSRKEPVVLPSRIPQLLINGTVGIAVGMATNIPPHNLGEVVDGLTHLIDNPEANVEDLNEFIQGPDFPTGGIIYGRKDILQAYTTGKGGIVMRGKAQVEEDKKGKFHIVVSEIPYQANKSGIIMKIAQLVKDKKLDGIKDLRDESDKDGVRIVVDLKDSAYPKKVLNSLYKQTDLQKTFHVNSLALVGGIQPRILTLKNFLEEFIKHRIEVVRRRTEFDLKKAKERAHILEGLKKALDDIDAVISTIRESKTKEEAHKNLQKKFKFTDLQATAILEMRLQTLAGLERKKIEDELKEMLALIKELEALLSSEAKIKGVIKDELVEIKDQFPSERRTKIVKGRLGEISEEDTINNERTMITFTEGGYIKRISPDTYSQQRRGGKGVIGMATKDEDQVRITFSCDTLDHLLFFTDQGRVFRIKAYEIPESKRQAKGQAIVNFLQLPKNETVTAIIPRKKDSEAKYLMMTTEQGVVKKTPVKDFENVRRSGLIAIKLKEEDKLKWVLETSGKDEILLVTEKGQAIRFKEDNIRSMGRTAAGVRGVRLNTEDTVVSANIISEDNKSGTLLVVFERGYGKQTPLKEYKTQNRGGSGIKTAKVTAKNGPIVMAQIIMKNENTCDIIAISGKGQVIRMAADGVSKLGRATQGVRIMKLRAGDRLSSVACIIKDEDEEDDEAGADKADAKDAKTAKKKAAK